MSLSTKWSKYRTRNGHLYQDSQMAEGNRLVKPNVVRIEVMDSMAREEYMGGFQKDLDRLRSMMMDSIALNKGYNIYEPFYGILSEGCAAVLGLHTNWQQENSRKSGFSAFSELMTSGNTGTMGVTGLVPGQMVHNATKKVFDSVESLASTTMSLSGVNNSSTGSVTIKKFTGSNMNLKLPLTFTWYLPEQENMCRISIKRLIGMAYVRPVDMDGAQVVNAFIDAFTQGILNGNTANAVSNIAQEALENAKAAKDLAADTFIDPKSEVTKVVDDTATSVSDLVDGVVGTVKPTAQDALAFCKDALKAVSSGAVDVYNDINTFFGGEITANPLPVRVTIGHYLDLEPMVITDVKFKTSKEQFISKDGTHLPITITASVTVDYWMQPGPNKDFVSILGNEVFEEYVDRTKTKKESSSKKKKK